jgi:hypothetical protein
LIVTRCEEEEEEGKTWSWQRAKDGRGVDGDERSDQLLIFSVIDHSTHDDLDGWHQFWLEDR